MCSFLSDMIDLSMGRLFRMSNLPPTLHMLCGKIAAGKSTLASTLANAPGTVLISEDDWLDALFHDRIESPKDYVDTARRLQAIMAPHVASLLCEGLSVVLDFPANTVENRNWMRGIFQAANALHQLHVLDVPDEICLDRLRDRNAQGDHPFAATEEQFDLFSRYYTPPTPEEGFNLVVHREDPWMQTP